MDKEAALQRLAELAQIAVEEGADRDRILAAVEVGLAAAEAARPRAGAMLEAYRDRYRPAA